MFKKKYLSAACLSAALGLSASMAYAAPLVIQAGPTYFQFNNLEQIDTSLTNSIVVPGGAIDVDGDGINDTAATEGNWGVINVSSVQQGGITTPNVDINGGPVYFADDGVSPDTFNQGQVTGIFYGVNLTSGTTATNGWLDLWWSDPAVDQVTQFDLDGDTATGTLDDPAFRTSANTMPGFAGDASMNFLVRLAFAPGIITGDAVTTFSSTTSVTLGLSGQADGFADVVDINDDNVIDALDGAWATAFNGDWFFVDTDGDGNFGEAGETRDLRFSTFYNFTATDWDDAGDPLIRGLRSNDPARVFAVPEPFTLGLLGAGLAGIGFSRRKVKA